MRRLSWISSFVLGACFSPSDDGVTTDSLASSSGSTSAGDTASSSATSPTTDPTGIDTDAPTSEGSSTSGAQDTVSTLDDTSGDPSDDDESTSSGATCGNGLVEDVEECDGTEGCTAGCELENFECHPVLQVDCPEGSQCGWDVFDSNFTCSAMGDVGYGEACTSQMNLYCEPGHICVNDASFPNCVGSGCCSNYCNTSNGDADCFAPLSCVSFWQVGFGDAPGPGLDEVGICVLPPP